MVSLPALPRRICTTHSCPAMGDGITAGMNGKAGRRSTNGKPRMKITWPFFGRYFRTRKPRLREATQPRPPAGPRTRLISDPVSGRIGAFSRESCLSVPEGTGISVDYPVTQIGITASIPLASGTCVPVANGFKFKAPGHYLLSMWVAPLSVLLPSGQF